MSKNEKYYIDKDGKIDVLNIKYKCYDYLGSKMGYKIYINGSKYPKKYGFYYTSMYKDNCIKYAIKDYYKTNKTED
tara:strand:+ start:18162 stop:18389 length:228 start_codon:yes stop_codon:yes gene_type:complete